MELFLNGQSLASAEIVQKKIIKSKRSLTKSVSR